MCPWPLSVTVHLIIDCPLKEWGNVTKCFLIDIFYASNHIQLHIILFFLLHIFYSALFKLLLINCNRKLFVFRKKKQ